MSRWQTGQEASGTSAMELMAGQLRNCQRVGSAAGCWIYEIADQAWWSFPGLIQADIGSDV